MNDRRSFLKSGAALLAGAGLLGAGAVAGREARLRKAAHKINFTLPKISAARVLRVTVGLRPHRPIGFRLETEQFGRKTVVHNYGHGGSGWSVSWGTGHIAAEEVEKTGETEVAVIGCGVVGLAVARLLQRRGKNVVIYSKDTPPSVTSNFAGARWTPTSALCDPTKVSPEFQTVFERAARLSHRYYQDLIPNPSYGVHYFDDMRLRDRPSGPGESEFYGKVIDDLSPKSVDLASDQHPFSGYAASLATTMHFEVPTYLNTIMRDFLRNGGRLVIREFNRIEDIDALSEKVVVNCMGLGAKAVFNDPHLTPIRGQRTLLAPQPDLNYAISLEGLSINPRWDSVVLGTDFIMGEWSTEPDKAETQRVLEGLHAVVSKARSSI